MMGHDGPFPRPPACIYAMPLLSGGSRTPWYIQHIYVPFLPNQKLDCLPTRDYSCLLVSRRQYGFRAVKESIGLFFSFFFFYLPGSEHLCISAIIAACWEDMTATFPMSASLHPYTPCRWPLPDPLPPSPVWTRPLFECLGLSGPVWLAVPLFECKLN